MDFIRRALDLDPDTAARLQAMAAERGQDKGKVVAEAVALLDSVMEIAGPDIAEARRRLVAFQRSGEAVPVGTVKALVESWGTAGELPRPKPQRIDDPLFIRGNLGCPGAFERF